MQDTLPHFISIKEFDDQAILNLFKTVQNLKQIPLEEKKTILSNKIVGMVFFQPSTRTRLGFQAAALKLGANSIGFATIKESRCVDYCNESLQDCIQVVGQMVDCIVLRHYITKAAITAAKVAPVPIINAGDGFNEHPVQAINDLWVIYNKLETLNNIVVGVVGDPNGRVLRSFILGLLKFKIAKILLMIPPNISLANDIKQALISSNIPYEFCHDIRDMLSLADVIEILPMIVADLKAKDKNLINQKPIPDEFIINKDKILFTNSKSMILHPGPRSEELDVDSDSLPNSMYFTQVKESIYVRMALLKQCLNG